MEIQYNSRSLKRDTSRMEDCGYYREFPSCDSSLSSSSFSSAGPLTPSAMSSRRPSLAEDDLLYVTDPTTDSRFNSPMAIETKAMIYGNSIGQTLQPTSIINPSILGDGLSMMLQYQTALTDEADTQSTCGFQLEEVFYRQTSQVFQDCGTTMSNADLLDLGDMLIDTRPTFYEYPYSQGPQMRWQDNGTIDPAQTRLYLDTIRDENSPSAGANLLGTSPDPIPDDLCSSTTQAVNSLESSPRSSDDCSMSEQMHLSGSTPYGSQYSSSVKTVIDSKINDEDAVNPRGQRAGSHQRISKSHMNLGYSHCEGRVRTGRIKKPETKSKSKNVTEDGIACEVTISAAGQHPCDICRKVFKRKEHLERHRKNSHSNAKTHDCPDPTCKRSKDSFKGRSDNKKSHIIKTHLTPTTHGQRNERWSKEKAEEYGWGKEWEKLQRPNAVQSEAQEQRTSVPKNQKSKSRSKSLRLAANFLETGR